MAFDIPPLRKDGPPIEATWFNSIRVALQQLANWASRPFLELPEVEETPEPPGEGFKKFYAKNDGYLYTLDKDGKEIKVGSGGAGSGGINLESSPYAQDGDNSWATFDDGATATGVDLTGGTATATFAADKDDTSILSGDFQGAYKLTFTAADHQGEGAAKAYSIPKLLRDKGYVLVSSLYSASAAIATGDMILAAYDVTNSELITIGANEVPGVSANGTGKISALIPIKSNTESLRVGFMRAVTTATAFDFAYSDFRIGPPSQLVLPPVEKRAVIDLTGKRANATGTLTWVSGKLILSRTGDIVTAGVDPDDLPTLSASAAACSIYFDDLPDWAAPGKLNASNVTEISDSFGIIFSFVGTNNIGFRTRDLSGVNQSVSVMSNRHIISYLGVPIESNIVDVAELELKAAKAELKLAGNQTVSTADPVVVDFTSVVHDPYGLASASDKGFKIKSPGDYRLTTYIRPSNITVGGLARISFLVNGVAAANLDFPVTRESTDGLEVSKALYGLKKDDIVTVTFDSGNDNDYVIGSSGTFFQIEQLIDLTAIAAIAGQNKFIVKTLSGDVTSDGVIADLTTTIIPERVYHVTGQVTMRVNSGGSDITVYVTLSDGTSAQSTGITASEDNIVIQKNIDFKFTATGTSLTVTANSATANAFIDKTNTRLVITELPNDIEVESF